MGSVFVNLMGFLPDQADIKLFYDSSNEGMALSLLNQMPLKDHIPSDHLSHILPLPLPLPLRLPGKQLSFHIIRKPPDVVAFHPGHPAQLSNLVVFNVRVGVGADPVRASIASRHLYSPS